MTGYFFVMRSNLAELDNLREQKERQKEKVNNLQKQTEEMKKKLRDLDSLDKQIKDLVGIKNTIKMEASRSNTLVRRKLYTDSNNLNVEIVNLETDLKTLNEKIDDKKSKLPEIKEEIINKKALLAAQPTVLPSDGRITSSFGYRKSPFGRRSEFHDGLDIAAAYGSPVRASADGVVVEAGWKSGYGREVIVDHGYGLKTGYGHNSKILVKVGQRVKKGEVISRVGSSGRSTGPHLHFIVFENGKAVDPRRYLFR
jgi:murein DD-endopeptidase MepM/ murein hydrolase activator NlpD